MTKTYKVEKHEHFNEYRVHEYVNGVWENSADNNWNKATAEKVKAAVESGRILIEEAPDYFPQLERGDLPYDA